jgi:uncharacterized glyoxalase superfamily protein PhnB
MSDVITPPAPTRLIGYADSGRLDASLEFYAEVLGFEVAMHDPVLALASPVNPSTQVVISDISSETTAPRFGIDLGHPSAVDSAHAACLERGLRVLYPLTDEAWGVRRFFVEDPGGTIVNVLAHTTDAAASIRPRLVVEDVDAAITYYGHYLDAQPGVRHALPSGMVVHAEVRIGHNTFSLTQAHDDYRLYSPQSAPSSPVLLTITVADANAVADAMVQGGATVVVPIEDRAWGKREGRLRDPFGHLWVISQDIARGS